jgi:hypothetical protein
VPTFQQKPTAKYSNTVLFQVQQNRSVGQVHRAMPSRPGHIIKLVSGNSTPSPRLLPSTPHTSRLPFLFSCFLSVSSSPIACFALLMFLPQVVSGSPVAPLVFLYIILHLAHTPPAELIPTTPAKTRLKCASPQHFAWPLSFSPLSSCRLRRLNVLLTLAPCKS